MLATAAPACAGSPPNGRLTLRKIIIPTAIKASAPTPLAAAMLHCVCCAAAALARALLELLILMAQKALDGHHVLRRTGTPKA